MRTYLVTTPPPTTNGDLHIGHLSGPYLAADVYVRYKKQTGHQAIYLCSGDDHQSYNATTAKNKGVEPGPMTREYTEAIRSTFKQANIDLDIFTSSLNNQAHIQAVQEFFLDMVDKKILIEKEQLIFHCTDCERYLFESFVKGYCPYCKESSSGNICEACGRANNPTELIEPQCSLCHATPKLLTYKGLFFPLEEYREALAQFYEKSMTGRPHLRALCEAIVSESIPDYPVTYPSDWGIPVPLKGYEDQVINVWFEMYPGYLATTEAWAQNAGRNGLAQELWGGDATLVQFLGFDNSFFYAVVHLAMSMAIGRGYILPEHMITNEFYQLNQEKFSTSRNHAIWGRELLEDVSADALRYHLCRTNPENIQTSFSLEDFDATLNRELIAVWSNVINGFLHCVHMDCKGRIPVGNGMDLQVAGMLSWVKQALEKYYDTPEFSLRQASAVLQEYVEGCHDYLLRKVLKVSSDQEQLKQERIVSLSYLIRGLAYFSAPLLPDFSQRLWETLGHPGEVSNQPWDNVLKSNELILDVGMGHDWFAPMADQLLVK